LSKSPKNQYHKDTTLPILASLKKNIRRPVFLGKAAIIGFVVFLCGWILNQNLFLTKSLTYHFDPNDPGQVVRLSDRSDLVGVYGAEDALEWKLNSDSLKFTVKIPRTFESAKVTFDFDNRSQSAISLTAQAPPNVSATPALMNVQHLNNLPWKHISNGVMTLWQRPDENVRQYDTPEQFQAEPPSSERIGVVGVDPQTLFVIPGYRPAAQPLILNHTFRGSHTLSLYAQDETLAVNFNKIDLNREAGEDTLSYKLSLRGKVLLKGTVPDDGITGKNRPVGIAQPVSIRLPNAGKGIYELELKTSEDVLLQNVTSSQHYLAFENHVFLADGPSYLAQSAFRPVRLSLLSDSATFETPHEEGLQSIRVGDRSVTLEEPKVRVKATIEKNNIISFSRGNVLITGNAIVLEPAKQFFQFLPRSMPLAGSPSVEGIDYLWAPYLPRETFGEFTTAKTFAFEDLFIKSKTLYFTINAPGLVADRSQLFLRGIEVKLTRGSLPWHSLWRKIQGALPVL
jgi:hypothetical protein